jgi:hypothetical protein
LENVGRIRTSLDFVNWKFTGNPQNGGAAARPKRGLPHCERPAQGCRHVIFRLLACLLCFLASVPGAIAQPPNVTVIISDDQGYGELSCRSNPIVRTPHLDRLGRREHSPHGFPCRSDEYADAR